MSIARPDVTIKAAPPITAEQLMGTTFDNRYNLSLGKKLIHYYEIADPNSRQFLGIVATRLGGQRINQLFDLIKRGSFGLDTYDLIMDWDNIGKPNYAKTLARHQAMPGWDVYWADREKMWALVKEAQVGDRWKKINPARGLVPMFMWGENPETEQPNPEMLYTPWDQLRELSPTLEAHTPVYDGKPRPGWMSHTLGVSTLFYFSPDITDNTDYWKPRDKYSDDCGRDQNMGSTQVCAYALKQSQHLFQGSFLPASQDYITREAKVVE